MQRRSISKSGFTVIELLVTIAVFGFVVPGIAGFVNTLDRINDRAREIATINAIVENKAESLRSISYVGIEIGTIDFTAELPATISEPKSAYYTVSSVSPALKQIDFSVSYNDHGQTRVVDYKTLVGELGVGQY